MRSKLIAKARKQCWTASFLLIHPPYSALRAVIQRLREDVDAINMKGSGVPADLLVCFPSRAHLPLMPKPLCSPSRAADSSKRHPARPGARGRASPLLFKTKSKRTANHTPPSPELDEPSSPKVTCAGQVKVRRSKRAPRPRQNPGPAGSWLEVLGLKQEIAHFLGALRGLRFGCFGAFHGAAVECTSDEEEEEEEEEKKADDDDDDDEMDNVLSNWFKELEKKHANGVLAAAEEEEEARKDQPRGEASSSSSAAAPPPSNALLLMRCRSAPAPRRWSQKDEALMEKEERLVVVGYSPEYLKVSSEIVKETWLVGSIDPLARSQSWKR